MGGDTIEVLMLNWKEECSDVLPWQCLTRYPGDCENVVFVDVDFPDLMERKRQTVLGTPELLRAFTGVRAPETVVKPVVFESDQYVQIGCDLRDLKTLQQGLAAAIGDLAECEFIFVAEVSITYMDTDGADEVIRWASSVGRKAEFVLLEQILPDGEDHPFASTMMNHFRKLNTPLKSVHNYPTVSDQHARFSSLGWDSVRVWTLWQAWADETFLSASDRRRLDDVEPFDEWEEFALFASHYCVVHARVGSNAAAAPAPPVPSSTEIPVQPAILQFDPCQGQRGQRRFAAAMQISRDGAQMSLLNVLGLGTKGRLQSCDVFTLGASASDEPLTFRAGGPTSRMCHSLTDLGDSGALLAGGRGSPDSPLRDCWIFHKSQGLWRRTHDLPIPLYRHSVTALGETGLALLVGGRSEIGSFAGALLYHPERGWVNCEVVGDRPAAVYGAVLACGRSTGETSFSGIYAGGLEDGLISDQILSWEVKLSDAKKPTVRFSKLPLPGALEEASFRRLLARFGATCLRHGDEFLILGGVAKDHLLSHQDEALFCSLTSSGLEISRRLRPDSAQHVGSVPRPLFVGHSVVLRPNGDVVVLGGGAVCFSMGTFWNSGVYTLRVPGTGDCGLEVSPAASRWAHEKTIDIVPSQPGPPVVLNPLDGASGPTITPIPRLKLETADDFHDVVRAGRPVVLVGLDLGNCISAWTMDYLVEKVGADRKVRLSCHSWRRRREKLC
ncbi:uncharacterized protein THITE_2124154 [Thermothielavioides terrestris NRRL 8126]|uniref:tRNA wybutosine-synthesizing protein 4 n=1 Tax=Thermothielavioides terrestris (strain ATCC 38088 / NRRL 8126) TaxID=578455 RepID=G2QUT5_THETT|nr:uncharacterized protein THITE_2109301 [Thermothielavioides terrestris NRRL 8126]XP_003657924.1 uncharacterized protein THITE_2124154 [Thermothielavioides terrestris NRRL 8126]AEO63730.1 hypothetical protein THITE_2109301 [Thermothielavioides terrestris NRRL 8126]AEO71588.1 hypothetical protein THITE_2124154 [Thermothielavioides terrestris NRRL 8126]